jgi:hypothetical protein
MSESWLSPGDLAAISTLIEGLPDPCLGDSLRLERIPIIKGDWTVGYLVYDDEWMFAVRDWE